MERLLLSKLLDWKNSPYRKPLVLKGVRQVGKTWILKEFGSFLIQRENEIFPVEVKSEANTNSKSLKKFKELFPDQVKLRVRFSLDNLKLDGGVLNIPLFMADHTDRLIGLALEQRNAD